MLFVLVICKPPFALWFTILKYKAPIVNFFFGMCWLFFMKLRFRSSNFMEIRWLFFMKSRFRSNISWEFVDYFSWNHDSGQTFHGNSLTVFHEITIQVKHFMGIRWLFFMKSQFRSNIWWECIDCFLWNHDSGQLFHGNVSTVFHEIAIQVKHLMGMYWLFFMKSRFRSNISWEFVDYFSWNRDSGQIFHGNSLTVNRRITNQVKQSARICWLYSMKSQFKSITLKNLRIYSLIWPYPQASILPSFFFVVFLIILSFMIILK